MNKLNILLVGVLSIILLTSCLEQVSEKEDATPKVKAKLSKIETGFLPNYIELSGKTIYLNKSSLIAPISGYVTMVNVRQGDKVKRGQVLFEMKTPEAFVMHNKDSSATSYGTIKVYAPVNGRIMNINIVSKGVFADKGAVMCILLASNDLKIQASIPYEYNSWAKIGGKCKIVLPDQTEISGQFSKILPQIDEASQTVKVLANVYTRQFIPENMIVRVLLDKSSGVQTQILSKKCLQTNALMSEFWVMKLINDSMAVQTSVTTGNQTHNKVEILSPRFKDDDLFISEGAYGLNDTILIVY